MIYVFPARAGMIRDAPAHGKRNPGIPRESGDDPRKRYVIIDT